MVKSLSRVASYSGLGLAAGFLGLGSLMMAKPDFLQRLIPLVAWFLGEPPAPHWIPRLQLIGLECVLIGLALFPIALLFGLPNAQKYIQNDLVVFGVFAFALLILWLPPILYARSAVIGGERIWWLGDDAMISMRYAWNLAYGNGLVWNAGERVEGYSNFLWTVYMGAIHLLPIKVSQTSLVVLLTNLLLGIALLPLLVRLVRILQGNSFCLGFVLLAFIFNRSIFLWATAGFESLLLTLLLVWTLVRLLDEQKKGAERLSTFLLIGLLSLVRADSLVLSAILYGLAIYLAKDKKTTLLFLGISLIPLVAHEIFRLAYYGKPLPNTAYLKVFWWDDRLVAGLRYLTLFVLNYAMVLGFAFLSWQASIHSKRNVLLIAFSVYAAYVTYVGGDAFPEFRFFLPFIPILFILAFLSIPELVDKLANNPVSLRSVQTLASFVMLALAISLALFQSITNYFDLLRISQIRNPGVWLGMATMLLVGILFSFGWMKYLVPKSKPISLFVMGLLTLFSTPITCPGSTLFLLPPLHDLRNIELALLLKQNTPPTTKIADSWAGSVFYFSERYGIDLLGKNDPVIAAMPVASDGIRPGHNKFDYNYSIGVLKPDFVVANTKWPLTQEQLAASSVGNYAFTGQLFLNPIFRDHCLPYPIPIQTWRTIFVCDWSDQWINRDRWKPLQPISP